MSFKNPCTPAKGEGGGMAVPNPAASLEQAFVEAVTHYQQGRLQEAESVLLEIQGAQPDLPDVLHMLAMIALQTERPGEAVRHLEKAVVATPNSADLFNLLGSALKKVDRKDDAVAAYEKSISLNPRLAEAHYNLGNALKDLERYEKAITSYQQVVSLIPDFTDAHYNLGIVLKKKKRFEEATAAYREVIRINPNDAEAHNNLANVFRVMGRLGEAKPAFDQLLRLNHGGPWWNARTYAEGAGGENAAAPSLAEPPTVSAFKLQDTADQLEYLIGKSLIDPSFERMIERYRSVIKEIEQIKGPDAVTKLSPEQFGRLSSFYNRVVHYADAPRIDTGVVNPMLGFGRIEDRYLSSPVSVTTIDDFLTLDALRALRVFCLESTIFFRFNGNDFVSSMLESGFNCGLLFQMAEELKERLPRVLGGHALGNMWVYRYRNQSEGVVAHTDEGAVTFNFWITPDDANGVPGHGGLMVYAKDQPHDWDWMRYNIEKSNPDVKQEIDDFLADAKTITIPYGENRAVLFHSNLFHVSDRVQFKDGFENRRMSVTMLFGNRGASLNNP